MAKRGAKPVIDPSHYAALLRAAGSLDQLSHSAWDISKGSYLSGKGRVRRSETTITDTFLESLDAIGVIEYYKFDAHDEEPRLGADWEWWIGSDADGWRCARIQAKRAKHYAPATSDVTPAYSELKHKVNGQLQQHRVVHVSK
ncbi:hypothetical protein PWF70_23565 (plasmid) [Gordonia sp. Swx-4]|uniref:DUF6615 family protein n=1 Tax=Gordonia sp. Swx-4 TaxID=3029399 RepID=UPI00257317E6|nr:DUF6615 family protein [Gordonia sp. Swx-4]WJG15915.1 hypothetical protein PWF70_23565 [Gordonia sp. Swx-4]